MSTNDWKAVWARRDAGGQQLDLDALIRLDGFDTGAGKIAVENWRAYAGIISDKLGLFDGATVFEVGCGAGAFLYALRERHALTVGGIDYSPALVAAARQAMPDGSFDVAEAVALDPAAQYDFVVANGVFHYFDQEYAAAVLTKMLKKARCAVAVLEVPDAKTRLQAEAVRRAALSQEEYEAKYAGLPHTYYSRDWFSAQAPGQAESCEVFDGCVPHYAQNPYRFGALYRKA